MEDFALQEQLIRLGNETEKILCEICKTKKEATHRCLECAQNVSADCGERHLRFASTSTHTVSTLEEIRQGRLQPSKKMMQEDPKCPKHKEEDMQLFCTTCEVLVCRDCTVVDHPKPGHVYINRNQAIAKYKQLLTELLSPLEDKLKEIERGLVNVSKTKRELTTSMDRLTIKVRKKADELRQQITRQEMSIVQEIETVKKEHQQTFDATEKACQLLSDKIRHSLEITKDMARIGSASESDFLSLYPNVNKDMKSLSGQDIPEVDNRLPYLKFKQGQGVGDINLGELVGSRRWELCHEFGKRGSGPGEFDCAMNIAARLHDEIAVADSDNHRVQILGVDGTYKCQIRMEERPRAVALAKQSNRLIVVCKTKVKVFNQDNSPAFQFSTVPRKIIGKTEVDLYNVAVRENGNILVCDGKRRVVTEHSPTGALIRTIPVGIKPVFLAAHINGGLIISSQLDAVVHVTDDEGTTLVSIKPTIGGQQVLHFGGVWSDHSGLYIAVRGTGTGHIHHYDVQGAFRTCIAQGLFDSFGITMTPAGQMAVADFYSVKIYH